MNSNLYLTHHANSKEFQEYKNSGGHNRMLVSSGNRAILVKQ